MYGVITSQNQLACGENEFERKLKDKIKGLSLVSPLEMLRWNYEPGF